MWLFSFKRSILFLMSSSSELTKEQLTKILTEVQSIAQTLKEVIDLLAEENSKPTPPQEEHNVVAIIPHVIREFAEVQGKSMRMPEIIGLYKKWSEDLYVAAAANKGHYKNKTLLKHIEQGYTICKSLEHVLESMKKKR